MATKRPFHMEERLSSNREGRLFHTRKVHIYTKESVFLI